MPTKPLLYLNLAKAMYVAMFGFFICAIAILVYEDYQAMTGRLELIALENINASPDVIAQKLGSEADHMNASIFTCIFFITYILTSALLLFRRPVWGLSLGIPLYSIFIFWGLTDFDNIIHQILVLIPILSGLAIIILGIQQAYKLRRKKNTSDTVSLHDTNDTVL